MLSWWWKDFNTSSTMKGRPAVKLLWEAWIDDMFGKKGKRSIAGLTEGYIVSAHLVYIY